VAQESKHNLSIIIKKKKKKELKNGVIFENIHGENPVKNLIYQ